MRKTLIIIALLVCSRNVVAQSIFRVVSAERIFHTHADSVANRGFKFYRIVLTAAEIPAYQHYPVWQDGSRIDTLGAIKELLSMQGDIRLCALPVMGYNPLSSQMYTGGEKNYSIQVEALFIINQLVLERPYMYAPYPVLCIQNYQSPTSVSGEIIDKAFDAYRKWYALMTEKGIRKIKRKEIMPLDGSGIYWY